MNLKVNPVGKLSLKLPDGKTIFFSTEGRINISHNNYHLTGGEGAHKHNPYDIADIEIDLNVFEDSFEVVEVHQPGKVGSVQLGQEFWPGWKVDKITKCTCNRDGTEIKYVVKRVKPDAE
jgi:hypothetical protein